MKKDVTALLLLFCVINSNAESIADKLRKKLENALESGVPTATAGSNKSIDMTESKTKDEFSKKNESCLVYSFDENYKEKLDKFFYKFKSLDALNHDEVAKKIVEDSDFACKKFYLCKMEGDTEKLSQKLFTSWYKSYSSSKTVGNCPWGMREADNLVVALAGSFANDLIQREKEFENYGEAVKKNQQMKSNSSDFKKRGEKIAQESKHKWELRIDKDELSKIEKTTAFNQIKVGSGSVETVLECRIGEVFMVLTFHNVSVPLNKKKTTADVSIRMNENLTADYLIRSEKFSNVFEAYYGFQKDNFVFRVPVAFGVPFRDDENKATYLYDYAIKIETSGGAAYIDMPPYNASIKKVFSSCK